MRRKCLNQPLASTGPDPTLPAHSYLTSGYRLCAASAVTGFSRCGGEALEIRRPLKRALHVQQVGVSDVYPNYVIPTLTLP